MNTKLARIMMISVMLIVLLIGSVHESLASSAQQYMQNDDEENIKKVIDTYFNYKYEGQRQLKLIDFSNLLADNNQPWVRKEVDKREIELYIASKFELNYISYNYKLEYDNLLINTEDAQVSLRESHEVVFAALEPFGIVSKLDGLQHFILLRKINGNWLITEDKYNDEIMNALEKNTKDELYKNIDENYQKSVLQTEATPLDMSSTISPNLVRYSYDRNKAKNYADTYWNTTNPPYYHGLSSDCTNFVSQALYAGEGKTPPDTSGMSAGRDYNWDWYYDFPSYTGSKPWINVASQWGFIVGNSTKIGPYGSNTTNYCNTYKGDVVQLYDSAQGGWFHEGMISTITSTCGGLQYYLVDAHTTNRYLYPLSNWSIYTMRFIVINGWNGN